MTNLKKVSKEEIIEELNYIKSKLSNTKSDKILRQLQDAKKDAPELYAAFNRLAIVFYNVIDSITSEREKILSNSVLESVEKSVVNSVLNLSVGSLNRDYLCRKLNQWAFRVAFLQSINGNIVEPAGFDCPPKSPIEDEPIYKK